MDRATWSRLRPLVEGALERPEASREAWLREACADEPGLFEAALELVRADGDDSAVLADARPPTAAGVLAGPGVDARLGPWRLVRELGRGGMGSVWLAARADDAFAKQVAIKLVRSGLDGEVVLARFRREQRLLASLEHPGIARLIDVGRDAAERPYLVLEHVDGEPIDTWCRARDLDLAARLRLFLKVCAAVEHAHARLVVHRDLKPGNVIVDGSGQPRLLDFGIAKLLDQGEPPDADLTLTGQLVCTPQYASPEQVRGEPIGVASDVYSLGVVLYELLTGERPYRLDTLPPTEALRTICELDPPPPSATARETTRWGRQLAGDLDAIVLTALRKEPERRYATVEALSEDLRRYLDGLPVRARPDTLGYRARKFLRRHGVPVAAGVGLVVALVAGLVGTSSQYLRAEQGWTAEAQQNQLARERLTALEELSGELTLEREAAVQRADDLERLTKELREETAVAEARAAEVRRFATALVFDVQRALLPLEGATRARELVVRLGLEHLDSLALEAADDPTLRLELADAYLRMGDVFGDAVSSNLGRTADAERAYRRALELARGLEGLPRRDGRPLVAEIARKLADVCRVLGRRSDERDALSIALGSLEGLEQDPEASLGDLVSTLAARSRLAEIALDEGDLDVAQAETDAVLALCERVVLRSGSATPALLEHSGAWTLQGDVHTARDELALARAANERAVELADEAIARGATDVVSRRSWYLARSGLASACIRDGASEEALWLLEENLEWIDRLASTDPANVQLERDLCTCLRLIGQSALDVGDLARSEEAFGRALEVARDAVRADPDNAFLRSNESLALLGLGRARARAGDGQRALEALLEAVRMTADAAVDLAELPLATRTLAAVRRDVAEELARLASDASLAPDARSACLEAALAEAARGLEELDALAARNAVTPRDLRDRERLRGMHADLVARRDAASVASDPR